MIDACPKANCYLAIYKAMRGEQKMQYHKENKNFINYETKEYNTREITNIKYRDIKAYYKQEVLRY